MTAFFTRPASARPLAVLRIGLALVLLLQAVALAPSLLELYGPAGIVQGPILDELATPGVPRIDWLVEALEPLGVSPAACVRGVFLAYVAGLLCLGLGWRTRASAVTAWLGHLMLCLGTAGAYGVDTFARIALFYCVVMPVGHAASLDRAAGRAPEGPTSAARLSLRVLQVHLCIAYLSAGLAKAAGEQWWTGEAVWLTLMQPGLGQFDFGWLASAPWIPTLAGWGTSLIEVGYPVFIWPRRTRAGWAWLTIAMHAGIFVTMGLWSFAAVMIVLNVAAVLVSPEPASSRGAGRGPIACSLAIAEPVHAGGGTAERAAGDIAGCDYAR